MNSGLQNIEKDLEYSFLYKNDPESLHILLSMIEHRYQNYNMYPKYQLMKKISISLKRFLSKRRDREYIVQAVRRLINDDISRFELYIVLEAYYEGYRDAFWVNKLERLAIEEYDEDQLMMKKSLYQHDKCGKALGIKSILFHELKIKTLNFQELHQISSIYGKRVLKKKLYCLNDYIDKQMIIDFTDSPQIKLEEKNLTVHQLKKIHHKCNQYLYNNVAKIFKESYWNGLNDAVLSRYCR